MPDQVYKVSWNGAEKVKYTYDKLGRLENKHTGSFDTNFTYEDYETIGYNGNTEKRTTSLVKSVETPTGTYTYTYDKLGNILNVTDGTYTTSYEYDSLNQLTRVNDEKAGKTYTYSYTNGNITEQNEYDYTVGVDALIDPNNTKTWEYNNSTWSDLLTNFNGESITYDEIGNPLTIGEKSLTWTGRQLQSITDSDSEIAYTYNGDGLRTSKTVNGTKTEYYYNGSILAGQKTGDDTLVFMYDNNSDIFGVIYNDVEYYYIKNAQNDVIGIADKDGNVLIKYTYDAWGKITSITKADNTDITDLEDDISQSIFDIATGESMPVLDENGNPVTSASTEVTLARINPILYRSYYYDKETEWYYLNTRYYSPNMCRFINADGYVQTGQGMLDKNMFAYCGNNPINNIDTNGNRYSSAANAARKIAIKAVRAGVENNLSKNFNVYICKRGEEQNAPAGSVVVIDGRSDGFKKDNYFEIVGSWQISDKELQERICQEIIDYNSNNNSDDYNWNRNINNMTVEWDWHNEFYDKGKFIGSSQSVNLDMGIGTNSNNATVQKGGYVCEKVGEIFRKIFT